MRRIVLLTSLLALLLGVPGTCTGQTATGQITGTVKDVPLLPVGVYSVTAEQQGFRVAKRSDIHLNVDQVMRVDLDLQVGEVTQTVEVQANAVAIDSETAAVGQVVSQRQVTELPLNGRNFLQLLFLGNGAVETGGEQGVMRQDAGNAISINGSRPTSNNYLLDGTSNTDTALGTPSAILSVDAIQEFKEQTTTYSAEYGFSANQINIVSKTGTNDLHGSVFWFLRNDALDANNFFNNLIGSPKSKLRQNQFGFVAGGPVYIPKAYNGRNKTFWLANYEGRRTRTGFLDFLNIPTPDQLAGRFTSEIIDPLTGQPFPNNTIPESRFTRIANLARTKFFPAPNANLTRGNYIRSRSLPTDTDQYTFRGDQQLGRYGTVFGRYTNTDYTNTIVGNTTDIGDVFFVQKTRNWQVSHSLPVGNNLVNQFRFGYVGATANQHGVTADQAAIEPLKLTGVFTNLNDEQRSYPAVGFAGVGTGLAGGGSAVNDYQASYQPMWDLSNTTTWIRGRHTLNFGANYRRWSLQRDLANDFLGQFTFSGFFTGNKTADNAVADMLLGYFSNASSFQPAGFSVGNQAGNPREFNFRYFAPYVQDDWKVTPRLTLNMGLRWDFRTVPFETNDRMGWRDLSNPRGGLLVADKTLVDKGIVGDGSYYKFAGRQNPQDASKRYVQQWSLSIQRAGGRNTTFEVNYIGNKGTHLLMRRNIAQALPLSNPALCGATPTPAECTVLARKPFPNFAVYIDSDWSGNSSYNAFNARLERRTSTMVFTTIYTWAKSLDNKSAAAGIGNDVAGWQGFLNNHDVRRDRGRSEFDVDHRLVSSFVYELPFGRGRKYLSSGPGLANQLIGGWQVNGIVTFQSGFPMTISAADVGGLNDTFNTNRADLVGDPYPSGFKKTLDEWFNKAAFVQPGCPPSGPSLCAQPVPGFLGTSGRGILRLPGINNWDTGVFKNFRISEQASFQFRFESFNVWNHPQWGGPVRNVASPQYGQITSARAARINQFGLKVLW